jgi:predicted O-methyltransferase YrrM
MSVDWKSITTPTPPDEMEQFEKYCQEVMDSHTGSSLAIEIGSYEGATAALMANYFDHVICIDPFGEHSTQEGERIAKFSSMMGRNRHFAIFMENLERLGLTDRVTPIISTSKCWEQLGLYALADFFFIDGAHTYAEVKNDLVHAHRLTTSDGLVVVHDYMRQPYDEGGDSYIGVRQAVEESISEGKFVKHHYYSGIVALKKSAA